MMLKTVALLAFSAAAFAQPTVTAVVNSTNYLPQLCPGMFASVYGTNFGTNAANVSVTVGGKPAYVYASSLVATQFAIEIPFEVSPGATTLIVTVSGAQSAPFNITLATYAPSFLTQNSTGSGPATVYESANTPVTLTAPAHPGDTLYAYAVGLGPTSPATPTGVPAAANPTATLPTLTVGGTSAKVSFAGITNPGVYQINFTVPPSVQGTQPLVATIGGVSSAATATLPLVGLSYVINNASFASPGIASPGSIATVFPEQPRRQRERGFGSLPRHDLRRSPGHLQRHRGAAVPRDRRSQRRESAADRLNDCPRICRRPEP